MTTEHQSALVQLYADVKSYVATKNAGTEVLFGLRERTMQINQGTNGANRIVFVPGRLPNGEAGELLGVDGPGETIDPVSKGAVPRALYLHGKIATLSVWAANTDNDPSASVDEAAQEQAIEQMFEWVLRAVRRSQAGAANVEWAAPRYNNTPIERRFGIELLAELVIGTQYFDDTPGIVFPTGVSVSRGDLG